MRDRALRSWRVGKRAESKERIVQAVNLFIEEFLAHTDSQSAHLQSETTSNPEPVTDPSKTRQTSRQEYRQEKDWAEVEEVVSELGKW